MEIPPQMQVQPTNDLQVASELLWSVAFAGCYALIAEYQGGNPSRTVGLLGHYDPSFLQALCDRLESVHQELLAQGLRVTGAYVFHQAFTTPEARRYVEPSHERLRRTLPNACFEIYEGRSLRLNYWIQRRQFFFGNTLYRFPTGVVATFDTRRGVTGPL